MWPFTRRQSVPEPESGETPSPTEPPVVCSFCGKTQDEVRKLIAGPSVYICDECIDLCNEIIDEELTAPPTFDIEIQAKELLQMRNLLDRILAHHTGQPIDKISRDTDRDFIMSAEESQEYGIIDEVITTRELAGVPQAAGVA